MKLLRIFNIGSDKILQKDCHVSAIVTRVEKSCLYVIKKPVRIGITEENTKYSHFIHFTYTVDGQAYPVKLFITPYYRCPRKGEQIEVYYDPEKPQNYACYAFGPGINPMEW